MIPKKRFTSNPGDRFILRFIANRNCQALISILIPAVETVVREFFVNVIFSRDDDLVFVRGKKVSFLSKTINEQYGLTPLDEDDEDEFSFYMNHE